MFSLDFEYQGFNVWPLHCVSSPLKLCLSSNARQFKRFGRSTISVLLSLGTGPSSDTIQLNHSTIFTCPSLGACRSFHDLRFSPYFFQKNLSSKVSNFWQINSVSSAIIKFCKYVAHGDIYDNYATKKYII